MFDTTIYFQTNYQVYCARRDFGSDMYMITLQKEEKNVAAITRRFVYISVGRNATKISLVLTRGSIVTIYFNHNDRDCRENNRCTKLFRNPGADTSTNLNGFGFIRHVQNPGMGRVSTSYRRYMYVETKN